MTVRGSAQPHREPIRRVVSGLVLGVSLIVAPLSAEAELPPTLRGWVVDGETGRPIVGATVVRRPWVQCRAFHGGSRSLRPQETRTSARGFFAADGRIEAPSCTVVDWGDELLVFAPGYRLFRVLSYGRRDFTLEDKLGPRPLRLTPVRTTAERLEAVDEAVRLLPPDEAGPLWRAGVAAARQLAGADPPAPAGLGR
jgi:hypothetical protein